MNQFSFKDPKTYKKISSSNENHFVYVAEEIPISLIYNGISYVVMMGTPENLHEFAIGFSLSEKIVENINEIYDLSVKNINQGIEIFIEISSRRFFALKEKRRSLAGRTGCGICGTEHLNEIYQPIQPLKFTQKISFESIRFCEKNIRNWQKIGEKTHCTHIAAWFLEENKIVSAFEDIGRHVALDKLLGEKIKQNYIKGAVFISSRASYEMVKKSVNCGAEILCALAAPTLFAIELANQANLTLVAFCRNEMPIVFSHPSRIN